MLYYQFRDSLVRATLAVANLIKYTEPDYGEDVPEHVSNKLNCLRASLRDLSILVNNLPKELDGHTDKDFGPVVHPDDLLVVLSIVVPLAEDFDADNPLVSHFPIRLFRDKCILIAESMNLYCEWKSFVSVGARVTTESFLNFSFHENRNYSLAKSDQKLRVFFKNIEHSMLRAKNEIESDFGIKYEKI